MLSARTDFATRLAEIDLYLQFACDVAEGNRTINPPMTTDELERFKKTLKANGFLLLYNLVESTIGNTVEAIFDELRAQQVRFDDCRKELQCVILNNLRKHNVDKIHPKLTDLSLHVVTETFRKKELFSGNVDARKVRHTATSFGFIAPRNGHRLLKVKETRNVLAHGDKSFGEVGRDSTTNELREIRLNVVAFLESTLNNVESYLNNREYLANP